jgi:hypothetical protein
MPVRKEVAIGGVEVAVRIKRTVRKEVIIRVKVATRIEAQRGSENRSGSVCHPFIGYTLGHWPTVLQRWR